MCCRFTIKRIPARNKFALTDNYLGNFGRALPLLENIRTGKLGNLRYTTECASEWYLFTPGGTVRKINPELWLLLFLVLIAAILNFLVASQRMALVFYFLPTLYSAYHFGRRHATLTAVASIILVVLLVFANPAMFRRRVEIPFGLWFDLIVWGGILMIAGYATVRSMSTIRRACGRWKKATMGCWSSCRISWPIRSIARPRLTGFHCALHESPRQSDSTAEAWKTSGPQRCCST